MMDEWAGVANMQAILGGGCGGGIIASWVISGGGGALSLYS